MGFVRFFLLVTLIQFMAALPIKMVLRWTINLKYIVYIPGKLLQHLNRSPLAERSQALPLRADDGSLRMHGCDR